MGSLCLTTVRKALNGNLDGPAIGDAIVKREKERWDREGIEGWKFQVEIGYGIKRSYILVEVYTRGCGTLITGFSESINH